MKFFISGAINPDMFITNQGCADYFGIEGISTFYCTFDSSCYFDHLFEYFGIPLPESLKAAVAKRKAEYLAGRYSAQQALALPGYPSEVVVIGNHRSPVWPKIVVGSTLAQLLERLGEQGNAIDCYRKGLALVTDKIAGQPPLPAHLPTTPRETAFAQPAVLLVR